MAPTETGSCTASSNRSGLLAKPSWNNSCNAQGCAKRSTRQRGASETIEEQAQAGQIDHRGTGRGHVLIVLAQTAGAPQPGKGALNDPASWQDRECLWIESRFREM